MNKCFSYVLAATLSALTFQASAAADLAKDLTGEWCMYDSVYADASHPTKETWRFNQDGSYHYQNASYTQTGQWQAQNNRLEISKLGSLKMTHFTANEMEADFGVHMKFKRGNCDSAATQKVAYNYRDPSHTPEEHLMRFHNAASTGEIAVLKDYIKTGINVNATDERRGETALIKAATFCHPDAMTVLLQAGADKNIVNKKGQTALDMAQKSRFHKGCPAGVGML